MFGRAKEVYETTVREIREARPLQGGARHHHAAGRRDRRRHRRGQAHGPQLLREQLPRALVAPGGHRGGARGARHARLRHELGALHLRDAGPPQELETKLAAFFGTEDTILYSSCFDANGGLFETLLGEEDAIISDALNHASIIDGIRLCKAERHRYPNGDMAALEEALKETQGKRLRMIATDGVFSMDGYLAKLDVICDLADKYKAMVMVDDSHASGFIGKTGRGTPEHFGVQSRIDVMTSTLGKALGGAAGGFTTGQKEIVELLRQRSRPYLFSNTIAPAIAGASVADPRAALRARRRCATSSMRTRSASARA